MVSLSFSVGVYREVALEPDRRSCLQRPTQPDRQAGAPPLAVLRQPVRRDRAERPEAWTRSLPSVWADDITEMRGGLPGSVQRPVLNSRPVARSVPGSPPATPPPPATEAATPAPG